MLLSAVSVLVVAQSSSEIPQGLMNNPVYSGPNSDNRSVKFTLKQVNILLPTEFTKLAPA